MDLTGITNHNEYFTNHYLTSIFEENAKETISAWRDASRSGVEDELADDDFDFSESDDYKEDISADASKDDKPKTPWSLLRNSGRLCVSVQKRQEYSRNDSQNMSLIKDLADSYLNSLGYPQAEPLVVQQSDTLSVPIYLEMKKASGAPALWVLLCFTNDQDSSMMDEKAFDSSGLDKDSSITPLVSELSNEDLATKIFFGASEPPRWLLFIGMDGIALVDRLKWNEKRYLHFDLETIFSRKEESTLQAVSIFLHRESLCPDEGFSLMDKLTDNSHRHANGVSQNLKYALREAIELLGNEVLHDLEYNKHIDLEANPVDTDQLTMECLRYMYRMLFVLFIESRPELGYAPIKARSYMTGYSLEHLREIADEAREDVSEIGEGYYIQETLSKQFDMIYNGYPDEDKKELGRVSLKEAFIVEPLKAHIFDSKYTKLIGEAKLRNNVMLKIITLMSISRGKGKKSTKGRISYSTLGINQMGAVYEALLSYRGFIATETLYEVKNKKDEFDELKVGYFVPERELENYDEDERVRYESGDMKGKLRKYEKGEYIYRLAGREREKSASYYTPEVLTQCLVKYALKELLKDKTSDDILKLAICEPAMGSAAFLNEAVNQLAEAYVELKQKESGILVSHEDRPQELQKVKMFLADRCVYGIDLNPVAVELAEVSLWLNTIYKGAFVPWFRAQLFNGNSLIGARRQVYPIVQLEAKKTPDRWWENTPVRVKPGKAAAPKNHVYHFLTGDPGMASYPDKVIKGLAPDEIKELKAWNKDFNKPYTTSEVETLTRITSVIDKLWRKQINHLRSVRGRTTDALSIYGRTEDVAEASTTIREKDDIFDQLYRTVGGDNASPYARLKFAMDYWCALWFWPIKDAELLPTRSEFFFDMDLILEGTVESVSSAQMTMFEETELDLMADEIRDTYSGYAWNDIGKVNLNDMCRLNPRLAMSRQIAQQQHFFHWELEFADIFADKGGFDLILGNPPWIRMEWKEQNVLSDKNPLFSVKDLTATQTVQQRAEALKDKETEDLYFLEYESMLGIKNFLNAQQNYCDLKGQQSNLYKCFLPQAWTFGLSKGISAYLHPDSIYDDPGGELLRKSVNSRLRFHFQFANEKLLFPEVFGRSKFSINIYRYSQQSDFDSISNLYDPITIDECYDDSIAGNIPGIKDDKGGWNIKGHPSRVIHIAKKELMVFAKLLDGSNEWSVARLPAIHAKEMIDVLKLLASHQIHIGSKELEVFASDMWDETYSQKNNIIARNVNFPDSLNQAIYSGPHITVANPMFKCPRSICELKSDFDCIDLTNIPNDYLQRCNYVPSASINEYIKAIPLTPWNVKFTNEYRVSQRNMINASNERTLSSVIIPPNCAHIHTILSLCFRNLTGYASGLMASIPFDFFIKVTGKSHADFDVISKLPIPLEASTRYEIVARSLLLNCLTKYYSDLWKSEWNELFLSYQWSKIDSRLHLDKFSALSPDWTWHTPLRTDFERYQALVELDVLSAMALGMTLDQLKTIYRIQFPVMQNYETDTWYDQNGRIVFTINRSLTGVGFQRAEWEKIKNASSGTFTRKIKDDTLPGGPVERVIEYAAPFDRCDRVQDFETAWKFFESKYKPSKKQKS
ncbi:MAG: class I SAM-dependent DNA methyltransferase [Clostridiales bacterium]|jgi:type I restriction-modification system DNA methylase subunit|nr:class I SAM-dependent DNA methyltransferase [Clostridiales bacterium]